RAARTALAGVAISMAAAGCSKATTTPNPMPMTQLGHGDIQSVEALAQSSAFYAPRDGAPSPDGSIVFFIAHTVEGPAIFKMPAAGGQPTKLAAGDPLVAPFGLAVGVSGQRLYIVDAATDA